jgi:hypothetical protein
MDPPVGRKENEEEPSTWSTDQKQRISLVAEGATVCIQRQVRGDDK